MTGNIRELVEEIKKGAHLCGRYHRYAEDTERGIKYTDLVVETDGARTYRSHIGQDTDAFFAVVHFEGGGVVSTQAEYESIGWWSC